MSNKIIFILLIIVSFSCNKNTDSKACWYIVDYNGQLLESVCNKTEPEVRSYIKNLPGRQSIPDSNLDCLYYKVETDKYCWQINNKCYKNFTTAQANLYAHCYFGVSATKVTCDSCCTNWYNRYMYRKNLGGVINYSSVFSKRYCGIALDTIHQSKRDTILLNQDSLIVLQYSENGSTW